MVISTYIFNFEIRVQDQEQQQLLLKAEETVRGKLREELTSKEATTDEFRKVSSFYTFFGGHILIGSRQFKDFY